MNKRAFLRELETRLDKGTLPEIGMSEVDAHLSIKHIKAEVGSFVPKDRPRRYHGKA